MCMYKHKIPWKEYMNVQCKMIVWLYVKILGPLNGRTTNCAHDNFKSPNFKPQPYNPGNQVWHMLHILGFIVHLHLMTEQTITCLFMNTPLKGHGLLGRKASIDLGLSMSFTCRSRTFQMRWTAFCIYHGIANPSKALNLNLWITSKTWEMTTACKDLYL